LLPPQQIRARYISQTGTQKADNEKVVCTKRNAATKKHGSHIRKNTQKIKSLGTGGGDAADCLYFYRRSHKNKYPFT
jgi:hypothetical protein